MDIKLIGIQGNREYESLKMKVLQSIKKYEHHIQMSLEEVNEVERILIHKLNAIPALIIGNQVIFESNSTDPIPIDIIFEKQIAMKKIIVPTDFSDSAHNALNYAKHIAGIYELPLKVVHVCHPQVTVMHEYAVHVDMDTVLKVKEKQLSEFIAKYPDQGPEQQIVDNGEIEQETMLGMVGDSLINLSKHKDVKMMVMGTTGESGFLPKIFGSIAANVSQKAECPVLLVPPFRTFEGIDKIMYACNFDELDNKAIEELIHLTKRFEASIHLVHVNEKGRKRDRDMTAIDVDSIIENTDLKHALMISEVNHDSVWEGLSDYAQEEAIDLCVIASKKRSFWENIIHHHHAGEIIRHVELPILLIHI